MASKTTIYLSSDAGAQQEMEYLATQIKEEPMEGWIIKEEGLALLSVDEELQAVKAELMEAEPNLLQHNLTFLDQNQDLAMTGQCQDLGMTRHCQVLTMNGQCQDLAMTEHWPDLAMTGHCQVVLNKLNDQDLNTSSSKESFEEITVSTPTEAVGDCLQKDLPTNSDVDKEDRSKHKKVQKHPKKRSVSSYSKQLAHNGHGKKITGTFYSCSQCNYSRIKTFKDLKKHIKSHLVASTYECQLCSYSTRKHDCLQKHYLSGHSRLDRVSKRIHCLLCPYNCLRTKTIRSHLFLTHLNKAKFQCSLCEYKTNCKYRLDDHNAVHKSERPYTCPHSNCSFASRHKSCIGKHIKKVHAKEKLCRICTAEGSKVGKDDIAKSETCQCTHLPKREKETASLEMKNMKPVVDSKSGFPFSCDLCGAGFLAKAKFQRHLLIHDSFKRFSCGKCDYSTNRSDTLKNHMLTHSKVRKYYCHICQGTFKCVKNLKFHIRRHSRFDTVLCPLCPYAAKSKSVLTFHLKSHGKEATPAVFKKIKQNRSNSSDVYEKMVASSPFKDEIQRTILRKRSSLMIPKSMDHYVCLICGFLTKSLGSLSQHKLIHEEKQYLCDFCAFRCSRKYNLSLHLLTHFKERPFKCQVCSFASKSPSNLIKHKKQYHYMDEKSEELVKIDPKYKPDS